MITNVGTNAVILNVNAIMLCIEKKTEQGFLCDRLVAATATCKNLLVKNRQMKIVKKIYYTYVFPVIN